MSERPPRIFAFNGDADGICALQQLRLAEDRAVNPPDEPVLVTGVKRHIALLEDVEPVPGAAVTVLDVAFRDNRRGVERLLLAHCRVRYFDHHMPGELPSHPALETHIDTAPTVCTSLLVNAYLEGAHLAWAVTGAFGDNMAEVALAAAEPLRLPQDELERLRELGELVNYNGYGETLADLHFHPADLFAALHPYVDPRECVREAPVVAALREGFAEDMALAGDRKPELDAPEGLVLLLPDATWARRVQGTYANRVANANRSRATAVGCTLSDGTLRLSIRAPLDDPQGADVLARRFEGGGRAGAAGINALPPGELDVFLAAFREVFGGG